MLKEIQSVLQPPPPSAGQDPKLEQDKIKYWEVWVELGQNDRGDSPQVRVAAFKRLGSFYVAASFSLWNSSFPPLCRFLTRKTSFAVMTTSKEASSALKYSQLDQNLQPWTEAWACTTAPGKISCSCSDPLTAEGFYSDRCSASPRPPAAV